MLTHVSKCHIDLWHQIWHYSEMENAKKIKKVTAHLPEDLLARAQKATGEGITETLRRGLQLVSASEAYDNLRRLRGKVKFSIDLKKLKEDRR